MAINDGGIPPILAQKHYTQPSALAPESLPREARTQKCTLQLTAVAADRLRCRLL
ncbi:hypothetical protein IVA95_23690 [Bradyrhizobium sp. 157]|jgi:hypothetical protein|uniref:hypothetical protein n=1 Tax=Bradyrhizobium sp. 157 TaxID=2782631 RepID=UPI001FF78C49|nr:hypothetical protein [Bradyrhizobium sp. 157]MCK1640503.1 hypothetical protein [Bradyrhizobium sp. 157]